MCLSKGSVLKITDIETHVICPPLYPPAAGPITRVDGLDERYRTIFVLHTDVELEGLGEHIGAGSMGHEWTERLLGTSPLDWLAHPTLPVGLAAAVYDLVGKYNQIPVYKLFGPKVRSRVPVCYWGVSQTPAKMAEMAQHARQIGYTWFKYHTGHFHNVIAQTEAIQETSPDGFKILYDLNFDSSVEHMLHLANELKKFPVAGAIEDPLRTYDYEGYRLLRRKSALPIYLHHQPLQGREAMLGLGDGFIMGHAPVGELIRRAGLFEAANVPFMIQNNGGNIMRSFVTHMAAVFPMATIPHSNHVWAEDVVAPHLEVSGGSVEVRETPGLGVELNSDALARWSAAQPESLPRTLIQISYSGLPPIYARLTGTGGWRGLSDRLSTGPGFLDGYGPGYTLPVDMDYLEDDRSEDFAEIWERAARGPTT